MQRQRQQQRQAKQNQQRTTNNDVCGEAGEGRSRRKICDPARQELWKTNVSSHGNKSFERLVSARKTAGVVRMAKTKQKTVFQKGLFLEGKQTFPEKVCFHSENKLRTHKFKTKVCRETNKQNYVEKGLFPGFPNPLRPSLF